MTSPAGPAKIDGRIDGHSYTSNVAKLLKHIPMLFEMQQTGRVRPVMIHVAPTGRCNLTCSYCCYAGRDEGDQLTRLQIYEVLQAFEKLGTRGLEWTGGGDPTLYRDLSKSIFDAAALGFKQGLITNAIKFDWLEDLAIKQLEWMRISFHGFNEGKRAAIEKNFNRVKLVAPWVAISGTYIWTTGSDLVYPEVAAFAAANKIPTRVTPDLTAGQANIDSMMQHVGRAVDQSANEFCFLSDFNVKTTRQHDNCYMHMVKPFIFPDGWVYNCPSIGLTPESSKNVLEEFRVCRIEEISDYYSKPAHVLPRSCQFCKYAEYNEIVHEVLRKTEHNDFA